MKSAAPRSIIAVLLAALTLTGCPGPPRLTLTHDGLARTYVLRVPPGHDPATPTPLVVVLHGGLGNAESAANTFPFEHLADEAGWLVAYPEGIDNQWNDGRLADDTDTGANQVDDVGFLEALIDALIESHGADPERVFMAGASNGGMMTYRFSCECAERLAGMAPVIAGVPAFVAESCGAAGSVPAIIFNGTDDPVVPFQGGPVGFSDRGLGAVISAPDSAALMAARNGCDATPLEEAFEDTADDDTSLRRWTYTDCGAAPVVFYIIDGGGHNVPGDNRGAPEFLFGPYSEELDIPETAWAFFRDLASGGSVELGTAALGEPVTSRTDQEHKIRIKQEAGDPRAPDGPDPQLQEVIAAWPLLPSALRGTIAAVVRAINASGKCAIPRSPTKVTRKLPGFSE